MEVAGWSCRNPVQIVFCQGVFDRSYAWWVGDAQGVVWEIIEAVPAPVSYA